MKNITNNVDKFVDGQKFGGHFLNSQQKNSSDADQLLKQLHKEEYETWELVNELIFSENLYFETQNDGAQKKAFCPKTLEIETLKSNHNALTIHAVAHWLESIYEIDIPAEKAKISQLND